MHVRRSNHDVTNTVDISSPGEVCTAVCRLLATRYPDMDLAPVRQAFDTFAHMYAGRLPGYLGCDTSYHDTQHSLDCTLALARLIDGHDRSVGPAERLGPRRAQVGIICALFHDCGYIRREDERHIPNGAALTLCHVARSGAFLAGYLPTLGFAAEGPVAEQIVHFTGYEVPLERIRVQDPLDGRLGHLIATADLMAQMADRCYPEKCYEFLYQEFLACGLAGPRKPGAPPPVYASPEDLLRRTPEFVRKMFVDRLDGFFGGAYRYLEAHFGTGNPYLAQIQRHMRFIRKVARRGPALLRRHPRRISARELGRILAGASAAYLRSGPRRPVRRGAKPAGKGRLRRNVPL